MAQTMTRLYDQSLIVTTPLISDSLPTTLSSCGPTQTMCSSKREDDNIVDKTLIIGVVTSTCILLIMTTAVVISTVLLWLKKKKKSKPYLVDNVAYNCHKCEVKAREFVTHSVDEGYETITRENAVDIATTANDAYNITNYTPAEDVMTEINAAYGVAGLPSSLAENEDIPTSANEAYVTTDIETLENPAYVAAIDDSLVYDYIEQ